MMHCPYARKRNGFIGKAIVRQTAPTIAIRIRAVIIQIQRTRTSIAGIVPIAAAIREPC